VRFSDISIGDEFSWAQQTFTKVSVNRARILSDSDEFIFKGTEIVKIIEKHPMPNQSDTDYEALLDFYSS